MTARTLYNIGPADLALIRASVHVRCGDGTFAAAVPPFICMSLSGTWELHAYGRLQGRHTDAEPVLAMLQRELAEPGWIAFALRPEADPEAALADAHSRQQAALQRATSAALAKARTEAEADAAWKRRRLTQLNPAALTLDDLE
jgi:hypothetical protein